MVFQYLFTDTAMQAILTEIFFCGSYYYINLMLVCSTFPPTHNEMLCQQWYVINLRDALKCSRE